MQGLLLLKVKLPWVPLKINSGENNFQGKEKIKGRCKKKVYFQVWELKINTYGQIKARYCRVCFKVT